MSKQKFNSMSRLRVYARYLREEKTDKARYAVFAIQPNNFEFWVNLAFCGEDFDPEFGDVFCLGVEAIPYNGSAFLGFRVLSLVTESCYEGT